MKTALIFLALVIGVTQGMTLLKRKPNGPKPGGPHGKCHPPHFVPMCHQVFKFSGMEKGDDPCEVNVQDPDGNDVTVGLLVDADLQAMWGSSGLDDDFWDEQLAFWTAAFEYAEELFAGVEEPESSPEQEDWDSLSSEQQDFLQGMCAIKVCGFKSLSEAVKTNGGGPAYCEALEWPDFEEIQQMVDEMDSEDAEFIPTAEGIARHACVAAKFAGECPFDPEKAQNLLGRALTQKRGNIFKRVLTKLTRREEDSEWPDFNDMTDDEIKEYLQAKKAAKESQMSQRSNKQALLTSLKRLLAKK